MQNKRMSLDLWFMSHWSDQNEFQVLNKLIKLISFSTRKRLEEEKIKGRETQRIMLTREEFRVRIES